MAEQEMTSVLAEPIPVEFSAAGGWYPGDLLGWRLDGGYACQVRVRCVIGGLRRTTWMPLTDLRLPEPTAPPRVADRHDAPHTRTGDWTLTPA